MSLKTRILITALVWVMLIPVTSLASDAPVDPCRLNDVIRILRPIHPDDSSSPTFQYAFRFIQGGDPIVVYHHAHLMQTFKSCQPVADAQGNWFADLNDANWLSRVVARVPELRKSMKIVIFDELGDSSSPNGIFKFSIRQSFRFPNADFATELRPFENVFTEQGRAAYMAGSSLDKNYQGKNFSKSTLSSMAEGLVWTSKASSRFRYKTGHEYLPQYCSKQMEKP